MKIPLNLLDPGVKPTPPRRLELIQSARRGALTLGTLAHGPDDFQLHINNYAVRGDRTEEAGQRPVLHSLPGDRRKTAAAGHSTRWELNDRGHRLLRSAAETLAKSLRKL